MIENEEEPTVTEGQVHLTDLADLAETDRMLDRIAARRPGSDDDDELAALLLALALDVDAAEVPTDPRTADPELDALIASWIADVEPLPVDDLVESDEAVSGGEAAQAAASAVPSQRNRHVARRSVRSYLPTVLRVGVAAAVTVAALGIGSLVTGDSLPQPGVGTDSSSGSRNDPGERVADLIQQAKAAVREGRPAEAVQLFRSACELVPQVNPAERPALQQALTELRQVLVTVPGAPSVVPEVPGVAAAATGGPVATPTPSPTPVQPTDSSSDPATTVPETTSDPAVTTPDPTPTGAETSPDPTDTEPSSSDSPTSVEPQNDPSGIGGAGDGASGDSVDPLASYEAPSEPGDVQP